MLIFRYLAKEVFITLTALTTILLLIFMSNQFVQYLSRAANGRIPAMIIIKLMMLELPNLTGLLLPLGFYVALLVAYGRLYAENEMTVLQACGYGFSQLLKHSFAMAGLVSLIVLIIMLWLSPAIYVERAKLLMTTGVQTLIKTIAPGRFNSLSNGKDVFYVESMNRSHTNAHNLFLARRVLKDNQLQWDILWAEKAFAETDPKTAEDYIILERGHGYEGIIGQANYQISEFGRYKARLPHQTVDIEHDLRTVTTKSLLIHPDAKQLAELEWRLSIPVMVLTLTLIAVPLSRVNSRSGKFEKLLPALLIYIIYANFMFVSRNWLASGKISPWLGVWWLHGLMLCLGFVLIWRNQVKPS